MMNCLRHGVLCFTTIVATKLRTLKEYINMDYVITKSLKLSTNPTIHKYLNELR